MSDDYIEVTEGTPVNCYATFKVEDTNVPPTVPPTRVLRTPTTVTFTTVSPALARENYVLGVDSNVTVLSTGFVRGIFTPSGEGDWAWEIVGTGAASGYTEGRVHVTERRIQP